MKEIPQPPRSNAQKVTSKSLQRVMISSGLSIALCMGCIAGSAWALFRSDITANSVLTLADLTPKITDESGTELEPVAEGINTFLLKANQTYDLSVSYIPTKDDLDMVWNVDALLSFKPIGSPQRLENDDLPEPSEPSSPEEDPIEETPAPPDNEPPSEDEEENEEQSPAENVTDSETEETPIPEEEQTERPEEEQAEHSEEDSTTTEEVHAQSSDENTGTEGSEVEGENTDTVGSADEGENTDTEGSADEGENTDTEGSEVEGENTDTEGSADESENTNTAPENSSNEEAEQPSEETTDEEDDEEKRRQELLAMLESESSDKAIDYPVHLVSDGEQSSFSVNGIKVRQDTLVTFQTVNPDAGKVPAQASALPIDTVPNYYQNDYPDTMYGSGTIASSGCGIVSLAMVATYMTDHTYLPDEMARYFGGAAESNMARMEKGFELLQIPYEKPENIDITYEKLLEGKVAIVLLEQDSCFTNSQHFIVLTGVTEDGKILVNDPNRDNEALYPNGFREGFSKETIIPGYQGAWVFDKSEMPEEPFIYYIPEPIRGVPRYPDISLTASQKEVIARIVYLEARGESHEGQQAVAEVILNRLASNRFGLTLMDIIFGQGQFRTAKLLDTAEPYQAQYDAIEQAIWGPYVLPSDIYYFGREPITNNVWDRIGNHVFSGAPIG